MQQIPVQKTTLPGLSIMGRNVCSHPIRIFSRNIFLCSVLLVFIIISGHAHASAAQDTLRAIPAAISPGTPYVFLDCKSCDFDYIREELDFVNYVRDPKQADIHVFVTSALTGDGGRMYEFTFLGRRSFQGTEYSLKHTVDRNATRDEVRQAITGFLNLGFASFMLQTPLATNFSVKFEKNSDQIMQSKEKDDPWNNWVFQVYLGSVQLDMESNKNEFLSRWGFFADKVTEDWKFRFRPYFNYDQIKIQTSSNVEPIISKRHRHGIDTYAIKSLGDHWSTGIFGEYLTFTSRNIKHELRFTPGIEYSLFPYREATRKSITFTYQLGYSYFDYYRETVFEKTEESLYSQRLKGIVNIKQPWGSLETGFIGSHYFHDASKRRIEIYGQLSVRVYEGLSISFLTDYNVVHDQLALPRGEATLEEILLKQRELATNFSFSSSIAISYTFGSRYANIVNTRFK